MRDVAIRFSYGSGPCRGRYFLVPPRKYPKRRHRGGAEILLPQEQAPSPMYPSRSAFLLVNRMFWCGKGVSITSYHTLYITFPKKKSR